MRARHRSRPSGPGAEPVAARRDRHQGTAEPAERGRRADHPAQIPTSGWRDILLRTWKELSDDHVSLIAAAVAFYGLLALFPAIGALISIWALALDPLRIEQQIGTLSGVLPPDAAAIVKEQAHKVAADVGGLSLGAALGIVLALYGAAKGMKALIEGLNIIYDEQEERGFIRLNLTALGLMLVVIVAMIVAIGAIIVAPILLNTHRPRAGRRDAAPTSALADPVRGRADRSRDHLPLRAEPRAGALALGQLGRGRCDRHLDARLHRVLDLRPELRQLQRDLRLARRSRHPADVVLVVGLHRTAGRRAQLGDGAPDRARFRPRVRHSRSAAAAPTSPTTSARCPDRAHSARFNRVRGAPGLAGCHYSMPRLSKPVTDADEQTKQITIGDKTSVVLEESGSASMFPQFGDEIRVVHGSRTAKRDHADRTSLAHPDLCRRSRGRRGDRYPGNASGSRFRCITT